MSKIKQFPTKPILDCITRRCQEERERLGNEFRLPLHLDLDSAIYLVVNLQLALRHPENQGFSATIARRIIDGIIGRMREGGYDAHAEMAAMGDDPRFDS